MEAHTYNPCTQKIDTGELFWVQDRWGYLVNLRPVCNTEWDPHLKNPTLATAWGLEGTYL